MAPGSRAAYWSKARRKRAGTVRRSAQGREWNVISGLGLNSGRNGVARRWALGGFLAGLVILSGGPAWAACTDVAAPGVDWTRCYMDGRGFSEADLSGAHLRDTSFLRATLTGVSLSGAKAYRAKFVSAKMANATLDGGEFTSGDFSRADLKGASLKGTDLRGAKFYKASLRGADLTGARLVGADLLHADLSGATWIDGKTVCSEGSIGQCE
ncbi:MAG: pentapeptide repeat-containing protein [Rhodospirillum sp.]|nr:pentapeptide repeat-containing protein [Rhodospirillum sp.]MCF8488477.1 pentapeptide repeat-containing protein [Rhodospirillum sp.]MCF8502381.1 pentapeptide repeat-containing protein [Rhodospirillum sp.]